MRNGKTTYTQGFTLTEVAIVLGVIGVIISAIWYAAGNVQESRRDNDAFVEEQTVLQNIISLMSGQQFPAAAEITSSMITSGVIPNTYVDAANTATADNPWSAGSFKIFSNPGGGNSRLFRISMYNVSRQGCMALLSQVTSCQVGQSACPNVVYTNGAASKCTVGTQAGCPVTVAGAVGWTLMSSAQTSGLCALNSYTGGTNSVEFDYSL